MSVCMRQWRSTEPGCISEDLPPFLIISDWVRTFLAQPHGELGREGDVCPFVRRAMTNNTVWLSIIGMEQPHELEIERVVADFREEFLAREPQTGHLSFYKAILIIFPDLEPQHAPRLIDGVQRRLKPDFVDSGLMIGEFHHENPAPGLHNPTFRPLRSPIPMLAVRSMVPADLPFLIREDLDPPEIRVRFLEAYLRHLEPALNQRLLTSARESLARARSELEVRSVVHA